METWKVERGKEQAGGIPGPCWGAGLASASLKLGSQCQHPAQGGAIAPQTLTGWSLRRRGCGQLGSGVDVPLAPCPVFLHPGLGWSFVQARGGGVSGAQAGKVEERLWGQLAWSLETCVWGPPGQDPGSRLA